MTARWKSSGFNVIAAAVLVVAGAAGCAANTVPGAGVTTASAVASVPASALLKAPCLSATAKLDVEEKRLPSRLPDNADPSVPQRSSFAYQMIAGGGLAGFGPALAGRLCTTRGLRAARFLVVSRGKALWTAAVDRARRIGPVRGSLPYSDDRPLYWTRLQAEAALTQWMPRFTLTGAQRAALVTSFDKASRGMMSIHFPRGKKVKRVILSGFDPYFLDGGVKGSAAGTVGNAIRTGNPSGATALALDGAVYRPSKGEPVYYQAYVLPTDYPPFQEGYLEDTVGPFLKPGPEQVSASVTVSQADAFEFDIEQWNGRYHGVDPGNDNVRTCPPVNGHYALPTQNPGCDISVVRRWGGPEKFSLTNPPQWTTTTLPVAAMIKAGTGAAVPRPPHDGWPDKSQAFGVIWHTNFTEFPNCESTAMVTRNTPVPTQYPPKTPPVPPSAGSCSQSGGGGNYLSNESAYRNTLLAQRLHFRGFAGHIHTPFMQIFDSKDLFNPSDSTFNAWRLAIVKQGENLLHVVGATAPVM